MWLSDLTLPGLASCGLAGAGACGFWFALSGDLNSSGDALVILLWTNKIPQTGKKKVCLIQVILREEDSVQGGAGELGRGVTLVTRPVMTWSRDPGPPSHWSAPGPC